MTKAVAASDGSGGASTCTHLLRCSPYVYYYCLISWYKKGGRDEVMSLGSRPYQCESETVAKFATVGLPQDVRKGSRLPVEGERCVVRS